MKKILLIAAILLPIVSSTPVLAGSTDYMMNMNNMSMSGGQTSQSTARQVQTSSVTIQNFAFMPSSITVPQGTTVTWTNHDSTAHTVTGDTSGGPSSSPIQPGQSYSFTFSNAGSFPYHCSIHPQMTGSVMVTANTAPNTPPAQNSQPSGSQSTTNPNGNASSSSNSSSPTSTAPEASEYSKSQSATTKLPSTGPTQPVAIFIAATIVGIGAYYLYFFIKKRFA